MKINSAVRELYDVAAERNSRLLLEVRDLLKPVVEANGWFYVARLKGLESFVLKIETGRFDDPNTLEDFFACTVVVHTLNQVEEAAKLVSGHFDLIERRPQGAARTHKRASDFVFDDLRLYVARRPQASGRYPDLDGIKFEVQIKTDLQYAWSLATHDLIYKTDTVSWPKERIAYQVKAMLEHAEVAIAEVERLAEADAVAKQDSSTESILFFIGQMDRFWGREWLPTDRKRLAENLLELLKVANVDANQLEGILQAEQLRIGIVPRDLDPYEFVVQALANSGEVDLEGRLRRNGKTKVVIRDDMDLPDWMRGPHDRIIIINNV